LKVLFDTNVVLDVLLNRSPHAEPAAQLFVLAEQKKLEVALGATTLTTIYYLMHTALGARAARKHVGTLLSIFEVARVDWDVLSDALTLNVPDFEDGVLHEAARHANAEAIVTRDPKGFSKARLRVYSPLELLRTLTM